MKLEFLDLESLRELTGFKQKSAIIAFLNANPLLLIKAGLTWIGEVNSKGVPLVIKNEVKNTNIVKKEAPTWHPKFN